jgi:hypothetical protein
MHCHIAWHTSEGLAIQLLERESELVGLIDGDTCNSTCNDWKAYQQSTVIGGHALFQDDSGI